MAQSSATSSGIDRDKHGLCLLSLGEILCPNPSLMLILLQTRWRGSAWAVDALYPTRSHEEDQPRASKGKASSSKAL